jgi:hypothetical protein
MRPDMLDPSKREDAVLLAALPVISKRVTARIAKADTDCIVVTFLLASPGTTGSRIIACSREEARAAADADDVPAEMKQAIEDAPDLPVVRIVQFNMAGELRWLDMTREEMGAPLPEAN